MRISGLASGMDINQIVDDMMRVRRMPVDKLIQDKQIKEWQRDAYREVNIKLQDFRKYVNDTFSRSANLNAKLVNSSNSNKVTATARSDAGDTSFTISRVTQLATAASKSSTAQITSTTGNRVDPRKSLNSEFATQANLQYTGNEENLQLSHTTIHNVSSVIVGNDQFTFVANSGSDGQWTFKHGEGENLRQITISEHGEIIVEGFAADETVDIQVGYRYEAQALELTVYDQNGNPVTKKFEVDDKKTLNQLISDINSAKMGINAFYDEHSGRISLTRTVTGKFNEGGNEIEIGGSLASLLKLDGATEQGGTNAKFVINGLETERTSNTFTINNTTFTLRDTILESDPPVTINVETDVEKIFNHVTEFITKYNEMIDFINEKLKEERHRDFRPLTEEQRRAMSEREIELWEEKARSGMLRNDTVLSSALTQMRMALSETVNGIAQGGLDQLSKIGIVTTRNFMDGGKLELNQNRTGPDRLTGEELLRKAIKENPEGLYQLFMAGSSTGPREEQGLSRRLINVLDNTVRRSIENRAGNEFRQNQQFTLGREIDAIDRRVTDYERRLQQYEDRLWRQFTAMEKAMQQANSQAEMLYMQLMPQ
ncbi:flagellar filament capping protein FliD [Alkalihalobacterium elongatum]|uniref:flagellar filament capping protein FliD n=1 Tax=Alkalihalobacterium elongatum TaxID=2675466 RepID=UPI001C1FF4DF|nr:flagellar filament capping protein FliD [Alkalihalobacterium elongatum]